MGWQNHRPGMQKTTSFWRGTRLLKNSFVYAPYVLLIRFEGEGNEKTELPLRFSEEYFFFHFNELSL